MTDEAPRTLLPELPGTPLNWAASTGRGTTARETAPRARTFIHREQIRRRPAVDPTACPATISIDVSIDKEIASETVWLEDPAVTMSFPGQLTEENEPVASCWNIEVIVD